MLTINNTLDGYLKDVEIKGNTVQDPDNLADIRSVGDKVEGQELYEIPVLSVGKNLWNYGDTKFVPKNADRWCNFEGTNELMYGDMTDKTSVKIHIKEGNYYVTYDADNSKNVKGVQLVEIQEKATYSILNNVLSLQEGVYTVRIKNELVTEVVLKDFMICASDVATPYEPYIEDKLTILSLVQLEKVGDVRDRIVCKDGVWGVEKNVITKLFDGSENNVTGVSLDGNGLNYRLCYSRKKVLDNVADSSKLMSNKFECFVYSSSTNNVTVPSFRFIYTNSELYCVVPATEFTEHPSTQAFKEKVASYGTYIKYPTTQPQFIPLPHDQQVKLRTFANKTNISFLTEIEGTIKAQVPKSLGATVNTHTEQINNLNKELDRVKKLEESTVSTVTTESDFTTVEATSNGYFEDVKLEGKTLVVNANNEVVEPGTEGATLKSVGDGVDEIVVSSVNSDNTKADKKRLLYYNNETQTWEKPILREWDSIEKHIDGKYYYHQRSAEVVLNGSENWNNDTNSSTISPATYRQSIQFDTIDIPSASFNTKTSPNIISDLLPTVIFGDVYSHNHIGISISGTDSVGTHIIINNNFTDVTELKQWLQANNLTVVYQLAQEKVYECTNIDLITYNGETNFIVESGVLSPKTTLKVHSNISNVVSLLQKKVSLLESNMTKYMITQNRLQLSSTYSADSVTFKVDYTVCSENMSQENYDTDLYNLILNNILVGKDNYNYDHMFNIIMDYASWSQISWDQFDILVGLMDIQHNPPIEEIPTDDEIVEEMPNEIM